MRTKLEDWEYKIQADQIKIETDIPIPDKKTKGLKNKELAEKVRNMPVMSSVGFGTMKECERLRHYIYTIHGKGCSVVRTIPSSNNKVEYRIWRVR